jgi:predicted porin
MKKLIALAFALVLATTTVARADTASDLKAQMEALQKQMEANQKQMLDMQAQLDKLRAAQAAPPPKAVATAAPAGSPVLVAPGNNVTFLIKGHPVQLYGTLDLSYDVATKGLKSFYPTASDQPVGTTSWLGGISSQSFVGIRSADPIGRKIVPQWQLETQIDVSSTSGTVNTNSNNGAVVRGGLTSRNSYLGFGNDKIGSFFFGKTDAPYKNVTQRMNYTSQTLGDYSVVMGNTGGDNRTEFLTRLDHSLWWVSPKWGDWTLSALVSPGQNRSSDQTIIPSGEADCAGGNLPGSGAARPLCDDGAWRNVFSFGTTFNFRKLYAALAYEFHGKVNRSGDVLGSGYEGIDIADEDAIKVGGEWTFGPRLKIAGAYESMRRFVPAVLMAQNERTREGFFVGAQQTLGPKTSLDNASFIWARANPTPGDPGQHNTHALFPGPPATVLIGTPNPDNMANMYTLVLRHQFDRNFGIYLGYADTVNHPLAHYDLGAGGRGLTVDCHDGRPIAAFDPTLSSGGPVFGSGPACFAGGHLQGFSTGLRLSW